jgi:hypothetical protein
LGLIRFNIADRDGMTSFLGPGHAIKMLVAACARGARNASELFELTRRYDDEFVSLIVNGLAVFDEHNLHDNTTAIETLFGTRPAHEWPPFRVYNDVTRRASMEPGRAGLIVFNLNARRIIQIQNSYAEIQRQDRGRVRTAGRPTRQLYHYDLPSDWLLVP